MDRAISDFIQALRHHGLPISPVETLDALNAAALIDIGDRARLKTCLGLTLAKTLSHRGVLDSLFDQFFNPLAQAITTQRDTDTGSETDTETIFRSVPAGIDHTPSPITSALGQQLLAENRAALERAMIAAAATAGSRDMQIFLQKNRVSARILHAMGDRELQQELLAFEAAGQHLELVATLRLHHRVLVDRVRDYVEQQYLLFSGKKAEQLRDQTLLTIKLAHTDRVMQQQMARLVRKAAKKLASLHSRRRRIQKRGLLDVRRTIAANAAFDGLLFHTRWKSSRIDRPRVMVMCDVSGSVSTVANFFLLFVYSLQEVLPNVRSFAFSGELAEVSNCFRDCDIEEALSLITERWGNRATDYGRALADFSDLALADIDHKTQIIMLGDARNNYDNGRGELWRTICSRAQRVLWLNPEDRSRWNTGDSIMREYAPYCSLVESCNSLRDIERILGRLLKYAR